MALKTISSGCWVQASLLLFLSTVLVSGKTQFSMNVIVAEKNINN